MGYGRAGFYVPQWVDHLVWRVPAANSSVLLPEFQHVAVDDVVADGPDFMAYWRVRIVDPERALGVLDPSTPMARSSCGPDRRRCPGAKGADLVANGTYAECSWGFYLSQVAPGRTRLLIRTRAVSSPAWLRRLPFGLIDGLLSHAELNNIKRRVEGRGSTTGPHGRSSLSSRQADLP